MFINSLICSDRFDFLDDLEKNLILKSTNPEVQEKFSHDLLNIYLFKITLGNLILNENFDVINNFALKVWINNTNNNEIVTYSNHKKIIDKKIFNDFYAEYNDETIILMLKLQKAIYNIENENKIHTEKNKIIDCAFKTFNFDKSITNFEVLESIHAEIKNFLNAFWIPNEKGTLLIEKLFSVLNNYYDKNKNTYNLLSESYTAFELIKSMVLLKIEETKKVEEKNIKIYIKHYLNLLEFFCNAHKTFFTLHISKLDFLKDKRGLRFYKKFESKIGNIDFEASINFLYKIETLENPKYSNSIKNYLKIRVLYNTIKFAKFTQTYGLNTKCFYDIDLTLTKVYNINKNDKNIKRTNNNEILSEMNKRTNFEFENIKSKSNSINKTNKDEFSNSNLNNFQNSLTFVNQLSTETSENPSKRQKTEDQISDTTKNTILLNNKNYVNQINNVEISNETNNFQNLNSLTTINVNDEYLKLIENPNFFYNSDLIENNQEEILSYLTKIDQNNLSNNDKIDDTSVNNINKTLNSKKENNFQNFNSINEKYKKQKDSKNIDCKIRMKYWPNKIILKFSFVQNKSIKDCIVLNVFNNSNNLTGSDFFDILNVETLLKLQIEENSNYSSIFIDYDKIKIIEDDYKKSLIFSVFDPNFILNIPFSIPNFEKCEKCLFEDILKIIKYYNFYRKICKYLININNIFENLKNEIIETTDFLKNDEFDIFLDMFSYSRIKLINIGNAFEFAIKKIIFLFKTIDLKIFVLILNQDFIDSVDFMEYFKNEIVNILNDLKNSDIYHVNNNEIIENCKKIFSLNVNAIYMKDIVNVYRKHELKLKLYYVCSSIFNENLQNLYFY